MGIYWRLLSCLDAYRMFVMRTLYFSKKRPRMEKMSEIHCNDDDVVMPSTGIKMNNQSLVYIGKIIQLNPIPNADFIVSATVICGSGGKWNGIVKKGDFCLDSLCVVFLPDALIPESEDMRFMEASNWRVKMRRFRGAPSEVVIMPLSYSKPQYELGHDVTEDYGVVKYNKPIPVHLQGIAIGDFPSFIPKTDEPNYQRVPELVDELVGNPYYISEKADGSSTTAYRYKGNFGICSRNLELERNEENGYWKVALKYNLEDKLPEGIALQWETCGPKIQGNPMGLSDVDGFAFSAYNIPEHRYLDMMEYVNLCVDIKFPTVPLELICNIFTKNNLEILGEGTYPNGKQKEGVVVRSQQNLPCGKPISFKVINLNYEK